ncbi:MAG: tetratricopeptide repeat protein, partial [Desulfobacteraceae bacterium]|nr:tetratricopeptide repeat protein [Desulfobacteraceae bacterium]
AEEWEKLVPDLRKFIDEHKGTNAATNAQVDLARALFETKRYDESIKAGNEAVGAVASGSRLAPLIRYQLAFSYAAAGKMDEAASQWTILKGSGIREYEREADWNLGKIHAQKKEFAKAEEMLQLALKASGDFPQPALIEREIARVKSEAGTQGQAK